MRPARSIHVIASAARQSMRASVTGSARHDARLRSQSIARQASGWMASGRPSGASRNDDRYTSSHSRDALRPRFAGNFRPHVVRGRRECRMRAAPAVSCAMCTKKCAHEHTGQRRTSDIPCAMALRLITCSPRRTALLPPLRPEKQLPPGALTPAPRRQDHTSSPYAQAALVGRSFYVHRIPVPRS